MQVRYIFNTSGDYVAFVSDDNLFNPNAEWIGIVRNGNEVYNTDGLYIGVVLDDDRIVRKRDDVSPRRVSRPNRPMRPMRPMRPLRRLRMPKVQYPYEDLFANVHGVLSRLIPNFELKDFTYLLGASIFAADDTFLGVVSKDRFRQDSISNNFGPYGGEFSQNSIFNEFGPYGGQFSPMSPFNEFSNTPPRLVKNDRVVGYLTTNRFLEGTINTNEFVAWLNLDRVSAA